MWEKIKAETKLQASVGDMIEEFEDDSGNVFNKKTFEDLRRQGLI